MMKNCSVDSFCQHKLQNGTMLICQYQGYCDFQLPRDSRPLTLGNPDLGYGGWHKAEETCEYCHLPLRKCKGHNIC